jgi:hypothetical protein
MPRNGRARVYGYGYGEGTGTTARGTIPGGRRHELRKKDRIVRRMFPVQMARASYLVGKNHCATTIVAPYRILAGILLWPPAQFGIRGERELRGERYGR